MILSSYQISKALIIGDLYSVTILYGGSGGMDQYELLVSTMIRDCKF